MNRDQPLLHFYHKAFLPSHDGGETEQPPPYVNEATLTHGGQIAQVNGVKIRFHRCVASGRFRKIEFAHSGTDRTIRVPGMLVVV
jgi:hypothetical protein